MHLRKIQNQRGEVSIDEPLNTDWTAMSSCSRYPRHRAGYHQPPERGKRRAGAAPVGGGPSLRPGAADHAPALWPAGRHRAHPEGGGRRHRHLQSYISGWKSASSPGCARSSATSACEKALSVRMEQAGLSCVILPSLGERQAVLASPPSSAHVPPGRRRSRQPSASGPASSDSPAWARPATAASPAAVLHIPLLLAEHASAVLLQIEPRLPGPLLSLVEPHPEVPVEEGDPYFRPMLSPICRIRSWRW